MSLSASFQKVNNKVFVKGQHQAAVVHLGHLALSDIAPADLMAHAAVLITQVLPVEYSLIWELLEDNKGLVFRAGSGMQEGLSDHTIIPVDSDSLEWATLSSQYPVVVEDIKTDTRFKPLGLILDHAVVSGVGVLMGTVEKPYGIIEVFSRQEQFYSQSDVHFLQSVASVIGMVLRHAYREEQHVTQNQLLRRELVRAQSVTQSGHFEWDRYEIKNRLIESRERERLRLAQDLHDMPIQDLYGLIYQLDDLRDVLHDSDGRKILDECDHTLHRVVNNLRTICRDLRPPSLSPFGLEVAIRDHVEKFRDQNPEIKVHLELMRDKQVLSDSLRLSLFRIYQQAIHNVARHSQATEVHIRFRWDDEMIILEVEDNGRGFEVPRQWVELVREEHFGLLGIAERVESIRGKLEIVSALGSGALVRAVVPRS
jgi:signal transduction histidine kinase